MIISWVCIVSFFEKSYTLLKKIYLIKCLRIIHVLLFRWNCIQLKQDGKLCNS